jgi:hypothetical protein
MIFPQLALAGGDISFLSLKISKASRYSGEQFIGKSRNAKKCQSFMRRVVSHTQGVVEAMQCPSMCILHAGVLGSETPRIKKEQSRLIQETPPLQPTVIANDPNRDFSSGCAIKKAQTALARNDREEASAYNIYQAPVEQLIPHILPLDNTV